MTKFIGKGSSNSEFSKILCCSEWSQHWSSCLEKRLLQWLFICTAIVSSWLFVTASDFRHHQNYLEKIPWKQKSGYTSPSSRFTVVSYYSWAEVQTPPTSLGFLLWASLFSHSIHSLDSLSLVPVPGGPKQCVRCTRSSSEHGCKLLLTKSKRQTEYLKAQSKLCKS